MYIESWFERAKELEPEQSILLPVSSKLEQTAIARKLREVKNDYIKIDPKMAMSINIGILTKDNQCFVTLKKTYATPMIGFLRDNEGKMSKIDISGDVDRDRMIRLMIKDGLSKEEISSNLGGLTPTEEDKFFPKL